MSVGAQICIAVLVLILLDWVYYGIRDKVRERKIARRGYWVGYVRQGSKSDKFALGYCEGDNRQIFRGEFVGDGTEASVAIPDEDQWREQMPEWLRERRAIVRERLQAEAPPFVTITDAPPPL